MHIVSSHQNSNESVVLTVCSENSTNLNVDICQFDPVNTKTMYLDCGLRAAESVSSLDVDLCPPVAPAASSQLQLRIWLLLFVAFSHFYS